MYVRYCAKCSQGKPLHFYREQRSTCMECALKDQLATPPEERAPVEIDPDIEPHAKWETALLLTQASAPGLCKALG